MIHELKTDAEAFQASYDGLKKFEVRINDRDFNVGDILFLNETEYSGKEMANGAHLSYTGRRIIQEVDYILECKDYGIDGEWVILSVTTK